MNDPDHLYTLSEIIDLLAKARDLGFSLERSSYLENLTIRELEVLINRRM